MTKLTAITRLRASLCFAVLMLAAACARGAGTDHPPFERTLLAASGVSADRLDHYAQMLDRLAATFRATYDVGGDARFRARALHDFLHQRVLAGKFEASASDIGAALDGSPFNCAASGALFLLLAARCGLDAHAVSVPGHVWCRVVDAGQTIEVETTCRTWFSLIDRSTGMPPDKIPPTLSAHRRRLPMARDLSEHQFLAIFHFNRGVTLIRQHRFAAAADANQLALALDPSCRPAQENLAAAKKASGANVP